MGFVWDETKRQSNMRKHGIDFEDAVTIFGERTTMVEDDRFDYGETRYVSVGIVADQIITVVHTPSGEDIRIISARKARRHEERVFWQSYWD